MKLINLPGFEPTAAPICIGKGPQYIICGKYKG